MKRLKKRVLYLCAMHQLIMLSIYIPFSAANTTSLQSSSLMDENLVRHGALPPTAYDSIQNLQRPTRLEDFMWTGSGDGPDPVDQDGGLAWEDNVAPGGSGSAVVRVTKTMVLYKTVMTTIYPVEMTPTVVLVSLTATPRLSLPPSLSYPYHDSLDLPPSSSASASSPFSSVDIQPSSSSGLDLQTKTVEPTPPPPSTGQPNSEKTTRDGSEQIPTPVPESQPEMPPSTDLVYQVKTTIKANSSEVAATSYFHRTMQKSLARVYASAFKRHLLTSLGVLNKTHNPWNEDQNVLRRRKRRSGHNPLKRSTAAQDAGRGSAHEDLDFEWMFQHMTASRLKHLAMASMNVSVAILNISAPENLQPRLIMKYIVCAEGIPIPAASAVQDLHLVSKREMEQEIGYEIINKAEALIGGAENMSSVSTSSTSPWLIVAITTICLMVVLILVIMYMVWKWKHNRLGDTSPRPRPQSGIEEGVVNPVFLGQSSPTERAPGGARHRDRSSTIKSIYSSRKKSGEGDDVLLRGASTRYLTDSRRAQMEELASELNDRLAEHGGGNVSPSSLNSAADKEESTDKRDSSGDSTHLIKLPISPTRPPTTTAATTTTTTTTTTNKLVQRRKIRKSRSRSHTPSPKKSAKSSSSSAAAQQRRRRNRTEIFDSSSSKHKQRVQEHKQQSSVGDELAAVEDLCDSMEEEEEEEEEERLEPFLEKFDIRTIDEHLKDSGSRAMDKISYGHLDVCEDNIARTPSDQAKKLIKQGKSSGGASGGSGQSALGMYNSVEQRDKRRRRRTQGGMHFPETIDEISDIQSAEDEIEQSLEEQDRELSERSFEPSESTHTERPMRDAQVQTPTKRSLRAPRPKPRARPRRPRPGKQSSESLISTESEEIIEVHHIDSSSGESNPLGRMRKRFHQFLDDAFNVMVTGRRETNIEDGRAKSAKVSISHHVETKHEARPWTSHVVREESIHRLRPKSATSIGPPKRAWTAGSERRCHSAKSESAERMSDSIFEGESNINFEPDECDATSTIFSERGAGERHGGGASSAGNRSSIVSPVPVFPRYPIYPDIPVESLEPPSGRIPVSSSSRHDPDPAVPLIQAIKEEIQRFEKVKVTESHGRPPSHSGI